MSEERNKAGAGSWLSAALVAVLVAYPLSFAGFLIPLSESARAQVPTSNAKSTAAIHGDDGWGETVAGLRARVAAVSPDTNEQKPEFATATRVAKYSHPGDVTLLVELKNVSDQPISLQGTRYGDNVAPPYAGKSVSETFAPCLFDCEYFDKQGRLIERAKRKMLDDDLMLSTSRGSAENVAPGKSLVMLIRPTMWEPDLERRLVAGDFQIRVRYHSPTKETIRQIEHHWPNQPLTRVWSDAGVSAQGAFRITGDPIAKHQDLVWGKPENGLRAAVEFRSAASSPQARRDTATGTFPYGSRLIPYMHIENVGDKEVSFCSESWRQNDRITLLDEAGEAARIQHPWYSGWSLTEIWTLKPKQIAVLSGIALGVAGTGTSDREFTEPIAAVLFSKPGKYWLRYELHFGHSQRLGKDGKKIIPRDGDFVGSLTTGLSPIVIRERVKEDDPP